MADEPQERRVLRPVGLTPDMAAAVYDLYMTGQVDRGSVHTWSDLLRLIEAAMLPVDKPATKIRR